MTLRYSAPQRKSCAPAPGYGSVPNACMPAVRLWPMACAWSLFMVSRSSSRTMV